MTSHDLKGQGRGPEYIFDATSWRALEIALDRLSVVWTLSCYILFTSWQSINESTDKSSQNDLQLISKQKLWNVTSHCDRTVWTGRDVSGQQAVGYVCQTKPNTLSFSVHVKLVSFRFSNVWVHSLLQYELADWIESGGTHLLKTVVKRWHVLMSRDACVSLDCLACCSTSRLLRCYPTAWWSPQSSLVSHWACATTVETCIT